MFYPAVPVQRDEDMIEAEEEHHVAHMLINELENLEPDDAHLKAKFMVLAENVRHHIKEGEGEILPHAESSDMDLEDLGQQMTERKQELREELMESRHRASRAPRKKQRRRTAGRKRREAA